MAEFRTRADDQQAKEANTEIEAQSKRAAGSGRGKRFDVRRSEIADVAARLFAERGYHATSIQDITDATGLKRGALYHYIEGKKDLLYEIHDRFIEPLLENVRAIVARNDSPDESLLGIAELIMRDMCVYREQITVFLHEWKVIKDDERWSDAVAQRREIEELVESLLKRGCDEGLFEITDVRLAVLAFFGMMNWSYQWFDPNGRYSPHEVAEQFTGIFLNGVVSRAG